MSSARNRRPAEGRDAIDDDWITALEQSLGVFGSFVLEQPVSEAWSEPSELEGYTVGGIAGHVLSLMIGLQTRVESGASEVEAIPYADWYGGALASREVHSRLIQVGEELASAGPIKVGADLATTSVALVQCLRDARPDLLIPLASVRGAGVRLDDFLRTRFVEITVHADDIASSTGLRCPDFPALAWRLAASVVAETMAVDCSDRDSVLATSRPGRRVVDKRESDV